MVGVPNREDRARGGCGRVHAELHRRSAFAGGRKVVGSYREANSRRKAHDSLRIGYRRWWARSCPRCARERNRLARHRRAVAVCELDLNRNREQSVDESGLTPPELTVSVRLAATQTPEAHTLLP